MILDRGLGAAGHEDELLDAGGLRLLDRVLDERLVDDGQHLLGHRLGRGQEPRAEAADREDRLANAVCHALSLGEPGYNGKEAGLVPGSARRCHT